MEVRTNSKKKRKKRRRRRRCDTSNPINSNVNSSSYFTVYHNNIRGIQSKVKSLEAITKSVLNKIISTGDKVELDIPSVIRVT